MPLAPKRPGWYRGLRVFRALVFSRAQWPDLHNPLSRVRANRKILLLLAIQLLIDLAQESFITLLLDLLPGVNFRDSLLGNPSKLIEF